MKTQFVDTKYHHIDNLINLINDVYVFQMINPLKYYAKDGTLTEFNKYTIENGIIKNAKGEPVTYHKNKKKYNKCGVTDDNGKERKLSVARAIASTMYGPPPTLAHTADHIDRNRGNDTDDNIRWLCKKGQRDNQDRPETYKSAFLVDRYGENEKTANEWIEHLKGEKNHMGREYTAGMISMYAQKKQHGFSYKEYPDLPGEIWKEIKDSESAQGRWKISNTNRVKYMTKYAENVMSGDHLGLSGGYPIIKINGKKWLCHILSFTTFFPEEYANKKPDEMILHEDDDPLDFRPHKLRLGTRSENGKDAHNNGKYDGTKRERMKCMSYINGIYELMHDSQTEAAKYLRHIGYKKASYRNISKALNDKRKSAYDRTWKRIV
jgi:hypothetical protein